MTISFRSHESCEERDSFRVHHSSPAKSGPPNDPPRPSTAKQPAPRWTHSLWIVGLIATGVLLFLPSSKPTSTSLAFSDWKARVDDNKVQTAVIDTSGKVTGLLTDGKTHYESRIPAALNDDTLAADLLSHKVKVSGTAASTSVVERHRGPVAAALARRRVLLHQPAREQAARGWPARHRIVEGEGLRPGPADDALRRRCRLRRGQEGDQRGRRLPQESRPLRGRGRGRAPGSVDGRPAGYRQDPPRARRRR